MNKLSIITAVLLAGFTAVLAVEAIDNFDNPALPIAHKKISSQPASASISSEQIKAQIKLSKADLLPTSPILAAVDCPPEAIQETETCGDDTNGGCLMDPGTEQFEAIECGDIICGTYWSNEVTRDLDWYELTLTERGFVKWTAVGEAPTRIWVYDGSSGCADPVYITSNVADPEDTVSVEVELFPGTYWFVVGPDDWYTMPCDGSGSYGNDYVVSLECELGTPILTATPDSIYGEALEGFSTTEILSVDNTGEGRLTFTAQAIQDIIVTLSDNSGMEFNLSEISPDILIAPDKQAGYDEIFEKFSLQKHNPDQIQPIITEVDCPGDGIPESEACGDNTNGGCAMAPGSEAFESIACNTTVCGTVWSDGTIRDTDWYLMELTEPTLFTWAVTADFPLMTIILLPGDPGNECDGYEALLIDIADPGDTAKIIASLPAGDFWLWVGPTGWYNMPCDGSGDYNNDYVASLTCEPPWLSIDIVEGVVHETDTAVEINVLMDAAELIPGTYTGRIAIRSNDYVNTPVDIPVVFVVNHVYRYIPGDANMAFGIWPAEVSPADVTYMTGYFRMANPSCRFENFFASADANGDCIIIGSDVTFLVQYFRGNRPEIFFCPDFPHIPPIEETYPECIVVPPPF